MLLERKYIRLNYRTKMAKKKYTRRRKPQNGGGKTRKQVNDSLMKKYSPTAAKDIVEEWTKSKIKIDKKYPNESSSKKKEKIKEDFAKSMGELGYNVTLKNKSKSPKPKSPKSKSPKSKSPKSKKKLPNKVFLRMFSNKK